MLQADICGASPFRVPHLDMACSLDGKVPGIFLPRLTVLKEAQNARPAHGLQLRLHQDQGVIDIRCNIPQHSLTGDDDMKAIGHSSKFWVWEKHTKISGTLFSHSSPPSLVGH